ncbi:MAG: hypothetical protein QOF25_2553 [Mycobacterium sp.]|nr:hypothetical protein [Mycobacterium sp.]
MGKHLDSAKKYFGRDTSGLLEGGRYALVHTRSLEFDDLRPYVPGDDVRDIDWKASARSGHVLIKRFVSEKHHKILVVADAGRNTTALAPSGEIKRDIAAHVIGAMGLITLRRSDEIGMVFGDTRGCVDIRLRRGETHIEYLLHRFQHQTTTRQARSDIITQLDWVARHYRHPLLIFVVSDEPDVDGRLGDVLTRLTGRHDVMWAMVSDMPAVGSAEDEQDGFDVTTGRFVLNGAAVGPGVIAAYQRAEAQRRERLSEFMTVHGVPHAMIAGSTDIRTELIAMTGVFARAG